MEKNFKKTKMIYASWNEFCMIWVLWHLSDGFSRELWSLSQPSDQDSSWEGSPQPKIEKNKFVLNWLLGKIRCFKPMLFIFFLSGKSPVADPPQTCTRYIAILLFGPNIGSLQTYRCVYVAYMTELSQKISLWSHLWHNFLIKYHCGPIYDRIFPQFIF